MKTLVVFNIFICVVFSKVSYELIDDWNSIAIRYTDECISESGADSEAAKRMFENHRLVDEEHIRCYFKCLSMKTKTMSPEGEYIEDEMVKQFIHITREIAQTCIAKFGSEEDLCKRAYLVALCVTEENYVTL